MPAPMIPPASPKWKKSGTSLIPVNSLLDVNVDSGTLFVDVSADRVGIGTDTPNYLLDVAGDINISTGSVFRIDGAQISSADLSDGSSLLKNVSEDTTPQLGGDLDCQGNDLQNIGLAEFNAIYDNGNSGTALTINWNNGNKQKVTLTGNCTFTFTAPSGPCSLQLILIQDATGSRTVTWPSSVKWPDGTAPTLSTAASAVDIVSLLYDGTNYYATSSLDFS